VFSFSEQISVISFKIKPLNPRLKIRVISVQKITMKITLNRVNDNFHFRLKNERGHLVNVDSRPEYGGNDMGASPMELVLMGLRVVAPLI
jgi:hypothetical protein